MPTYTIRDSAGNVVNTIPSDSALSDAGLIGAIGAKAPAPVASAQPAPPSGNPGGLMGRVMDRGAESAKEIAGFPVRVGRLMTGYDKPQSFEDAALLALGNAPLLAATGGAAGAVLPSLPRLAPAIARVIASAGLAKGRGEDTGTALLEGAGALTGEVAGAAASKVLATPAAAIDAIRDKIGPGVNTQLFDALLAWWKADPNAAVQTTRAARVVSQLRALDPSGEAASIFKSQVARGAKLLGKQLPAASPGFARAAHEAIPYAQPMADAALSATPQGAAMPFMAASQMNPLKLAAGLVR